MPKSQVELFLEKVGTDKELKEKILKFEQKASASALEVEKEFETSARSNAFTIIGIAKEAGFDIPRDFFRQSASHIAPADEEVMGSRCTFTCCYVATSCLQTCEWTQM
jgi:Nif11 domain